jgi:hypothetical protein
MIAPSQRYFPGKATMDRRYFFFVWRTSGAELNVNSTTSSPVWVLMS